MAGRSQLRINIVTSLGSSVLSALLMAAAYPLYLHYLGYERYGLWLVLSTVLTMAQVGNLGISPALVKLVAEDYAAGDLEGVYRYIGCGMMSLLGSGLLLIVAVVWLRERIVELFGLHGDDATTAYALLPYIAVLSVYLLMADAMNSALAGMGRYDLVSYCQLIGQLFTVVTAIVGFRLGYGIWSLLIANALDALFLNVISVVLIRRITGRGGWMRMTWDVVRLRRILNFGSWVFGANLLNTVIYPLNKIFITRSVGVGAVPVYDLSFATCFKVRSFFESGFRSLAPEFSSLNATRPVEAQKTLSAADSQGIRAVVRWGTVVYLPVFLFCGWGLQFWLRARFTPELPEIFRIMLLGTYLGLWGLQPWYSLLGFGRSRHIFVSNAAQALVNFGAVWIWPMLLHRAVTLSGVTWATCLGLLAATLYLRWQGRRLRRAAAVGSTRQFEVVPATPR